jgi:dihydroxyacid dehydratase/phosphogluconate dehydratase
MSNSTGKIHSNALTEGPKRAAARSYLRGVGFSKEDLHKPIIGVANTWTEIGPCNFHLRDVATAVKQGIREAGGTPMEFNTVTISDGITMGTEGMKAGQFVRRHCVHRGLRQEHAWDDHGAGAAGYSRHHAVRRVDRAGASEAAGWQLERHHDPQRL